MITPEGLRLMATGEPALPGPSLKERMLGKLKKEPEIDVANPPALIKLLNEGPAPMLVEESKRVTTTSKTGNEAKMILLRFPTKPDQSKKNEFGHKPDNEYFTDLFIHPEVLDINFEWIDKVLENYGTKMHKKIKEAHLDLFGVIMGLANIALQLEIQETQVLFDASLT